MNFTHVTRVNNVVRKIKSTTRSKLDGKLITELEDGTIFTQFFATLPDGTIRPVEHTAQGEVCIIDEFPLTTEAVDEFPLG